MRLAPIALSAFLLGAASSFAVDIDLTKGTISAVKETMGAATELQTHLETVSGVKLPIVCGKPVTGEFVWHVGVRPEKGAEPENSEAVCWRIAPDGVWFWGGKDGGVDHAVEIFAEEKLGCRWPFGTAAFAPRRSRLSLDAGDGSWSTPLRTHRIRSFWRRDHAYAFWSRRMVYGGHDQFAFGHAFVDYWNRYSKDHPDFFAMRPDGLRLPMGAAPDEGAAAGSGYRNTSRISLCVSSPGLLATVVSNWVAAGAGPCVNLCENDAWPMYHCHCAKCYEMDGESYEGDKPDEHHAGRYIAFANRVLAEARKVRPDVRVCTYAYNTSTYAPANVKLDRGVVLGLVPVVFGKAALERYLADWKRAGMTDFVYRPNRHYYYRLRNLPLGCDEHFFDLCRMMHRAGAVGFDYDSPNATGLFEWEVDYIVAHAMRDPSKPFSFWMKRYAEAFGSAAADVASYYAYWRENVWKNRLEPQLEKLTLSSHVYDFAKGVMEHAADYYREEDFVEAGSFLRQALDRPDLEDRARALVKKLAVANRHAQLTFRAIRDKGKSTVALDELIVFRRKYGFKLRPWEEFGRSDACGMSSRPDAVDEEQESQYAPTPDPIWTKWQ